MEAGIHVFPQEIDNRENCAIRPRDSWEENKFGNKFGCQIDHLMKIM